MRPLRVALLSYRSKPHCGGQGVYVRHLARELVGAGHHVEVFSGQPYPELDPLDAGTGAGPVLRPLPSLDLYRDDDPFRTPALRELRDGVDLLELAGMWTGGFPEPLTFSLRAARALAARRGDFDVVHDNQSLGYGLLRLARTGLPLVATIHHPITVDRRHEIAAAPSVLRRASLHRWYGFTAMQARVARRIPTLLTVSESSAGDLVRDFGVRREAVRVIPVGVDTDTFRPPVDTPRVADRVVAVSSSDSPMKGVRVLLEAIAKLRTERDVELVVVGRPRADGPVARAVDDFGIADAVRFVTGLPDPALAGLFGSAAVAVVPSLYEGFSIPAVEAMACATPLVASRAGALPEVVGDCGVLVEPGNPSDLAAAIGGLLDDPGRRAALGAAGRQRVLDRFTWQATAAATAEAYAEAITRHNRRPWQDARTSRHGRDHGRKGDRSC